MKTILSTNKKEIFVDDTDYEWASKLSWSMFNYGAVHNAREWGESTGAQYQMHRVIMGLDFGDPRVVDHINHNRADNRRCNLRICTQSQNMANQRKRRGTSSKYKGVSWDKKSCRWKAYLCKNSLGYFKDELDAAAAYDIAALAAYGEFALPNFEIVAMGEFI